MPFSEHDPLADLEARLEASERDIARKLVALRVVETGACARQVCNAAYHHRVHFGQQPRVEGLPCEHCPKVLGDR